MPLIQLETFISAPITRVFDLARSIDLHSISTKHTKERAVAGCTSGLIGLGETVTWEAYHLGFKQRLTSSITALDYPYYFRDEQVKGIFKSIYHEHIFQERKGGTLMRDLFMYQAPLGFLGRFAEKLLLNAYLTNFLKKRNEIIKHYAETQLWQEILK